MQRAIEEGPAMCVRNGQRHTLPKCSNQRNPTVAGCPEQRNSSLTHGDSSPNLVEVVEMHKHDDIQLNCFQEFLIYILFLRRRLEKDILAQKFFGHKSPQAMRQIICLLRTWAAAMYEVLRVEDWWLKPEHKDRVKSKAFAHE